MAEGRQEGRQVNDQGGDNRGRNHGGSDGSRRQDGGRRIQGRSDAELMSQGQGGSGGPRWNRWLRHPRHRQGSGRPWWSRSDRDQSEAGGREEAQLNLWDGSTRHSQRSGVLRRWRVDD